jgi:hypothetical protein
VWQDLFEADARGRGLLLSLVETPFDKERHAHVYKKQVGGGARALMVDSLP